MYVYVYVFSHTYFTYVYLAFAEISYVMSALTCSNSPVFCSNNATTRTLHCVYDSCFESLLNWTLGNGLTIPQTSTAYSGHISFLTFDYSTLPFGYHPMDVFYQYHEGSPLDRVCSSQHCTCSYSFTLDISG